MLNFRDFISESFDSPYPLSGGTTRNFELRDGTTYTANTPDGTLEIQFWEGLKKDWSVDFGINGEYTILLNSPNVFRILATVLSAIKTFIEAHVQTYEKKPELLTLTSYKTKINDPLSKSDEDRRHKVYMRMCERFASKEGYGIRVRSENKYNSLVSTIELRSK